MLYEGKAFFLSRENDTLELHFDSQDDKVNVFNANALKELNEAIDVVTKQSGVDGLILSSGKSVFVAGADITEFLMYFKEPDEKLQALIDNANTLFNKIEDLPFPTVAAINGEAQGGGFEYCLSCDFRVASTGARLSRLIGVDNAVEWMCTGASKKAAAALTDGAIDAVVADDALRASAQSIIDNCKAGKFDIAERRAIKTGPITLSPMELTMALESAKGVVGAKAGPHYPSPLTIIDTIAKHADKSRDEALPFESASFIKLAKTDVAESLVGIFLKDQSLKRISRKHSKAARKVEQSAVLGAGIMGGGVAYQSASNGVPIVMKDIRQEALDDGLEEAGKLLKKQMKRGKIKPEGMADVLNAIQPALSYGEFNDVDLVVEAVVENPKIKASVLAEVEQQVTDDTIITTNTSTISVNLLSEALKRPENFCGMHFFNPVHLMPLVEVIRSKDSSEAAIATTVAYALALRKTPIVVNDCPGFLVNRILFAYFTGFNHLINDGADFVAVDKALEKFGWPMGPAYLLDVIGMDTAKHAADVMGEGFPDRMKSDGDTVIDVLYNAERLGQKNSKGFYQYVMDKRGKPKKTPDDAVAPLIKSVQKSAKDFSEQEILDRLMIPLCIESARCVEDNIVDSAAEADMGLVYGIGFPPFRGGALHYVDKMGLAEFCQRADALKELGPLYTPTDTMRDMAANGTGFYSGDKA